MASEASTSGEGSLERLNIAVSTTAPEDLLTPNAARAVRFRKSKPWGLLESDVKDFQEITIAAIAWYLEKLHKRDLDVYNLGKELDTRETQIANLNLQLASAQYNSGVKDAIDRNEEDKEMADLLSRVAELEADLATARQDVAATQQELANARQTLIEAQNSSVTAEPVTAPVDDTVLLQTQQDLAAAQNQIETLTAANKQLEEFADEQEKYIDSLLNQFEEDATAASGDIDEDDDENTVTEEDLEEEELYPVYDDGSIGETPVAADAPLVDDEDDYIQDDAETDEDEADDELYEADQLGGDYEDDDTETDFEPEPEPEPVAPPVIAPVQPRTITQPAEPDTFTYNGVKLPPGIRPEDL